MEHQHHNLKKIKVSPPSSPPSVGMESPGRHHYAPSFSIDAEQMPEIKSWEVGGKYRLIIEVEQKSKSAREDSVEASFDITHYKHIPKKTIDEMTDQEFEKYQGESLAKGELA